MLNVWKSEVLQGHNKIKVLLSNMHATFEQLFEGYNFTDDQNPGFSWLHF